ncbi:hypothetical protein JMJ58_00095 [Haloterrigena salifodinae]|uniref:PH domain-containing protein n=1 Tax=Haloterrigena salifodinae TaxID=2675099 RepID=A0A8T8E0L6_9EURY|nr:hypothetical protein [Haloterrigena salifodinae]QRV15345.1 hypothetical protein JMJ58_00095 [Haloterrigena salifodinae]
MAGSETEPAIASAGPIFEEHQSMPPWFGPALVALSAPALPVAAVVILDAEGVTGESVAILAAVAVLVLAPIPVFARARLRTTVREDGVAFRFSPFHRSERRVRFDEITDVRRSERGAYQYGLRRTRWGWEYRPNAREGVEIRRERGPAIFLGSERPRELLTAIETGLRQSRTR